MPALPTLWVTRVVGKDVADAEQAVRHVDVLPKPMLVGEARRLVDTGCEQRQCLAVKHIPRPARVKFFLVWWKESASEKHTLALLPLCSDLGTVQVRFEVLNDVKHIVTTDQKVIEIVYEMCANVLPYGSRLLPHVVI